MRINGRSSKNVIVLQIMLFDTYPKSIICDTITFKSADSLADAVDAATFDGIREPLNLI